MTASVKPKARGKKQASVRNGSRAKGVNPDDPKLKPKWADYETYEAFIDSFTIAAKWKDTLKDILRLIFKVGDRVIEVGKKVIEAIIALARRYPKTAATALLGAVLTLLVSNIPVLGALLSPILTGLTIVITFGVFMSEAVQKNVLDMFSPLKHATLA